MKALSLKATTRCLLAPGYFCLLAVIVFGTQFAGTGFGNRVHHSWVSSHILAIVSHATPVNGFVGHSRAILDDDGTPDYQYFDRSPFVFGALSGTLVNLTDNLTLKVWIARQMMHVIFMLTMLLAWRLLRRLGARPAPALVMVTLGFSGYMLLYYREMFDYEHASLLGMLLLLTVIAEEKQARRPRRRRLMLVTLLALTLGRGYTSLSVLGLWVVLEAADSLAQDGLTAMQRLRGILTHQATRLLLLGVVWISLLLAWNVAQEMARRDVPLTETGVVDSMSRRLPGKEAKPGWTSDYAEFTPLLERRLLRWFLPLDEAGGRDIHHWALLPALVVIVHYSVRQEPARRNALLLTAFSGLVWLLVMINHSRFHDFTTMHALGFALVFWLALLERVRRPRVVAVLLALSLALFLRNSLEVEANNSEHFRDTARYTEEYDRILRQIGRSGQAVYSSRGLQDAVMNRSPVVLGFYLGDNVLAQRPEDAGFVVSAREILVLPPGQSDDGEEGWRVYRTQTPEHRVAFLFDTDRDHIEWFPPADIAPRHNFGDELWLGHQELRDSVQVRPCQRVRVESWWQASAPPQANYALQLSLTDEGGGFLASADSAPLSGDTRDWIAGGWYPDGRVLQIPCDAAAGAYSLILSVYDPDSNAASDKLALINADGSEGDTRLYLTTLFVD